MTKKIRIVFDGPPGPVGGKFVEVENERGESIKCGEWVQVGDYWILEIPYVPVGIMDPTRVWTIPKIAASSPSSYCATHDTRPAEGDPCWECANPHIIAADLSAAREGFDRGYTKATKFVDELEARIANLVIDKNETFWRGYAYAIEVVTRLGRENMP